MKACRVLLVLPLLVAGCTDPNPGGTNDIVGDGSGTPGLCAAPCAEGTVCDGPGIAEGEVCGTGECDTVLTCQSGECIPEAPVCDDANPCTDDACDPVAGCLNVARSGGELACGVGECRLVVVECVDGRLQECTPKAPGTEVCDGLDNDCNGLADDGLPDRTCGLGVCMVTTPGCVEGKVPDCEPKPELVTNEICNGKDDDCNGTVDDPDSPGCTPYLADHDGDGYSASSVDYQCLCNPTAPYTAIEGGDCDDLLDTVYPGADEYCNGIDDNCNGATDEENAIDCVPHFADLDEDGHGAPGTDACLCGPDETHPVTIAGDCNDEDPEIHAEHPETCDGKDNNCDEESDEEDAEGCIRRYVDNDKDGFGVTSEEDFRCLCAGQTAPAPYTAIKAGDCCDEDANVRPGQTTAFSIRSKCNSFDYNCDKAETWQATAGGVCDMELVTCNVKVAGWSGQIPGCGENGQWLIDCSYNFGVCDRTTELRTQKCL